EYYVILEIYLNILIRLDEYDYVVEWIEAVLQEGQVPPERAEEFYKMLDLCQNHYTNENGEDHLSFSSKPLSVEELEEYKNYLRLKEKTDPYVKGKILQFLKDNGIKETVDVSKNGKVYHVDLESMKDIC